MENSENINLSQNNKTEKIKEQHKFHMHDFLGSPKGKIQKKYKAI